MKTIVDYATKVKEQHALNKTLAPVETDLTDASRAYAIGEQFIYNGELFKAKTAIAQHDALVLNTNYEAADNLATEIEALTNKLNNEIVTRSALGAKNILPFDLAEIKALNTNGTWAGNVYTYRGVVFTVNSDGTISATGTATGGNASIKLFAASSNYEMLGKEVILTGCPSNGSASTYRIQAYRMASADGSTGTYFDDGAGTDAFTVLNDASGTVGSFAVAVYENATVTNLLFKPMVRLASDPDATYQPYAKTNQELTAENQTLTQNLDNEIATRLEVGAHQLFNIYDLAYQKTKNTAGTWSDNVYTYNGGTWTVNDDMSVTAGGTPTTASDLSLFGTLPATEIKFKNTSASTNTRIGNLTLYNSSGSVVHDFDYGSTPNDTVITADLSSYTFSYVKLSIKRTNNNVAMSGTWKPLVTVPTDPSTEFTPYAKTNRELTDFAALADRLVSDGVNRIIDESALPSELTTGVYRFDSSRTTGLWAGYGVIVLTLKNSAPNGVQLAFKIGVDSDVSSNFVAYRLSYNNTWSNWAKLSGTNVT